MKTVTLHPVLAIAALAAFHVAEPMTARANPPPLAGTAWAVSAIDGKPPMDGTPATLAFDTGGNISGNASCNRFSAPCAIDGSTISVTRIRSTRRFCSEPVMAQERRFLALLASARTWKITADDTLVLRGPDGEIRAVREPEDAAHLNR